MEKEFVLYSESYELKELGFDEPCFGLYHNDKTFYPTQCKSHEQFHGQVCSAPLYQQAFRWFREKYNYDIVVSGSYNSGKKYFYRIETAPTIGLQSFGGDYRTYEEAELACLRKLINLVKQKP